MLTIQKVGDRFQSADKYLGDKNRLCSDRLAHAELGREFPGIVGPMTFRPETAAPNYSKIFCCVARARSLEASAS